MKFFSKRDCCTMIRPTVDEDKLQILEELEIESLRAEFIDQVIILRRKVLNQMPVKKINGHAVDGATWIGMVQLYVEAINSGDVPNIESSWNSICRQ